MTYESYDGITTTGSGPDEDLDLDESPSAGYADIAGSSVAENLGTFPGSAVHDGTTQPNLDTSKGLVSALGGQDLNPMAFAGSEITPTVNLTGSAMNLMEANQSASGAGSTTEWLSHPEMIGYQRPVPVGDSSTDSESETLSPEFDSGMNDGSDGQELERVENFYTGAEENPTSAQSAPTPRAEQQVSGASAAGRGRHLPAPRVAQPGACDGERLYSDPIRAATLGRYTRRNNATEGLDPYRDQQGGLRKFTHHRTPIKTLTRRPRPASPLIPINPPANPDEINRPPRPTGPTLVAEHRPVKLLGSVGWRWRDLLMYPTAPC